MNPAAENPLDQLRPMIVPAHDVSVWPLAPGWWGLVFLLLMLAVAFYALRPWWVRRQQRQQIRANAQDLLNKSYLGCQAMADHALALQCYLQQSNEVFKRLVHHHPLHEHATHLNGAAWITFLRQTRCARDARYKQWLESYGDSLYARHCDPEKYPGNMMRLQAVHEMAQKIAQELSA